MKIRTDFVTNSSSQSTMIISIDNLVLLEILQRYKEMGVFGEAETVFEIGSSTEETKTLAIHGETWDDEDLQPKKLGEVLDCLIGFLNNDDGAIIYRNEISKYDQGLFELMKNELLQRKEEIDSAYTGVNWENEHTAYGSEVDPDETYFRFRFRYDSENGEKYDETYYEPEVEEDSEEKGGDDQEDSEE